MGVVSRALYTISGMTNSWKTFAYTFRKDEGMLTQITVNGENLLNAPLTLNCFRAPTDNDSSVLIEKNMWTLWTTNKNFGNLEYTEISVKNFKAEIIGNRAVLTGDFIFGVQGASIFPVVRLSFALTETDTLLFRKAQRFMTNFLTSCHATVTFYRSMLRLKT